MGFGEQGMDIAWGEVGNMCADSDILIEERNFTAGGLGLGKCLAGIVLVEEDLTLKIAFLDKVAVDEGEGADAGAGEQSGGGGAGGSHADEGDVSGGEFLLAGIADGGKEYLAGVSPGCERGRRRHESLV